MKFLRRDAGSRQTVAASIFPAGACASRWRGSLFILLVRLSARE